MSVNLDELGGPYRTVFDVGGSVGAFAEACHRRWPDAWITSFEALADVAAENARRADGRWRTIACAIADYSGGGIINRNLGSSEASTLLPPGTIRRDVFGLDDKQRRDETSVRTLDLVAGEIDPPALLKIDVEGAELMVLQGGRATVPLFETVVIEVNADPRCFVGAPTPDDVDAEMRDLGFQFVGRVGVLVDPRDGRTIQFDGKWARR